MSYEIEELKPNSLEVIDGKIFVEGVETIDAELIGMAFLDFAENLTLNKTNCELKLKENVSNDYIVFVKQK